MRALLLALWSLCLAPACSQSASSEDEGHSAREATRGSPAPEDRAEGETTGSEDRQDPSTYSMDDLTDDDTAGLPTELNDETPVWEVITAPGHRREASARRVYADGTLYAWGKTRRARDEDGQPTRVPARPAWRLDARISADAVRAVAQLVSSDFAELPRNPTGAEASRYPLVTYRAYPDGEEHAVIAPSTLPSEDLPDPIREIMSAIRQGTKSEAVPFEQEE